MKQLTVGKLRELLRNQDEEAIILIALSETSPFYGVKMFNAAEVVDKEDNDHSALVIIAEPSYDDKIVPYDVPVKVIRMRVN